MHNFNKLIIVLTIVFITINVYKDGQYQFTNSNDIATSKTKSQVCQDFYNNLATLNQQVPNHNVTGSCY